jgi:hypothetical protein
MSCKNCKNYKLKPRLKGTEPPYLNFFGTLMIGWFVFIVVICHTFFKYLKMLFFMSREEQSKKKWAFINGKFNFLQYISGDMED